MERRPPQPNDAYQHWLDDAAQMGLMLYRMRNDSKRERALRGHAPLNNPPNPIRMPPPEPVTVTPRTAAIQVPTIPSTSTSSPH